jgi:CRP/FNR family transcriptional regulator, cyclic AMP receptor protein
MSAQRLRQPKDPALGGWGRYAPAGVPKQFKPRAGGHMRARIPKQQIDLLKAVPLFAGCSQGELRSIAQLGSPITVEKDSVLTAKGSAGREFFLVLSGIASCQLGKREIAEFTTGGYFGELALLGGGIRTADVVAETDMDLLVLDAREFRSMLMTTPAIGVKMLARLADRLADADAHYSN